MTLYNRPRAEVFADNAPPSEIQPFQAWLRGLGIAFDETNGFPEMTGLNGLFNALNQYIKYLEQNGFAEWSADLEYPIGAGVRVGSTWYRARTRNTNKPPATSQNDWDVFLNGADVASASTTVKGIVQLSNVLNSTSTSLALTAAQGKVLQDGKLGKNENAASATKLQTARTIGGVAFDGTANINLPGVNTTGNQNTTGTATNCSRSIVAGNGLSGGGVLNADRTLTLGTPSTVTASTTNSTTGTSHTHNLDINSLPLLGVGQTWQNVTGSRSKNTTYTNTTGRPIYLKMVIANNPFQSGVALIINSIRFDYSDVPEGSRLPIDAVIPSGGTYRFEGNDTIITWAELR